MSRHRERRLVTDINITPFTDVILVLLVIFMITTPLITPMNLKISLPEAKSGVSADKGRQAHVAIVITRKGIVYIDEKLVSKKELKEQIKIIHTANPEMSVSVYADKLVKFQEIVGVLDILSELGITRLNIAAQSEQ